MWRSLDHTQLDTQTPGRTPLKELSARRRGRYLHNKHNRGTSTPSVGFEPAIPAIKRFQTYALDRTATWISKIPHKCNQLPLVHQLLPLQRKTTSRFITKRHFVIQHCTKRNTLPTVTDLSKFCYRIPFQEYMPILSGAGVFYLRNPGVRHVILLIVENYI